MALVRVANRDRHARKAPVERASELGNDRQSCRNRLDSETAGQAFVDFVEFVRRYLSNKGAPRILAVLDSGAPNSEQRQLLADAVEAYGAKVKVALFIPTSTPALSRMFVSFVSRVRLFVFQKRGDIDARLEDALTYLGIDIVKRSAATKLLIDLWMRLAEPLTIPSL